MAPAAQPGALNRGATSRTGLLFAVACAQMLAFGVVMALLGALLPELAPRLGFGLARAGSLFLTMNGAMLAASLAAGAAIDRAGFRLPMAAGPLLAGAAMAMIAAAASFLHLIPAMLALGLGGGTLNAAANTLTADIHPEPAAKNAALNRLGVFFGVGALLMPLLAGALLTDVGPGPLLAAAATACVSLALAGSVLRYPAPKARGGAASATIGRLLRHPLVLIFGALLWFQSGNEFLLGGYLSTFLVSVLGLSLSAASFSLASYWAAILAARMLWSRLLLKLDGRKVILASAGASALTSAVLAAAEAPVVALAMVPLLGASLAAIFPTTLGLAGARFPEQSGSVFGLLFAMALAGGMSLPWAAGQLGEFWNARAAMAIAPAGFVAIAGMAAGSGRRARAMG